MSNEEELTFPRGEGDNQREALEAQLSAKAKEALEPAEALELVQAFPDSFNSFSVKIYIVIIVFNEFRYFIYAD